MKLPFYKCKSELDNSKSEAFSRLYAVERKFKENLEFEIIFEFTYIKILDTNLGIWTTTNHTQFSKYISK